MVEIIKLDRADRIILDRLQRDGSQPIADIAAAAGMSTSPCWRRIKLLKERGVIRARKCSAMSPDPFGKLEGFHPLFPWYSVHTAETYLHELIQNFSSPLMRFFPEKNWDEKKPFGF